MFVCRAVLRGIAVLVLSATVTVAAACTPPPRTAANSAATNQALPALKPAELNPGERLQIVATTSIIADVVSQVGGDEIDLISLIPAGSDPHGFEATPQDLIALDQAHAVVINGLGLEESMASILDSLYEKGLVVPVNAGVQTRDFGGEQSEELEKGEGDHVHTQDPHTWFRVSAVKQWVANIQNALGALDPAHADTYASNAAAYLVQLENLEAELSDIVSQLPMEQRKLITDHDSLGYFADEYGFEVVGTVIPSLSSMASPSAAQLAALQDQIAADDVKAIFVSATVNPAVAQQIGSDTGAMIVTLYSGSLSEPEGPASTYLDLMRYDTTAIVDALK